jgi:hypothetical protein
MLAPSTAAEWLEVVRTGKTDWRVSDSRRNSGDPERVVGFVERMGRARFEILWMTNPLRWGYVGSLRDAMAALLNPDEFEGTQHYLRQERTPRHGGLRRWEY